MPRAASGSAPSGPKGSSASGMVQQNSKGGGSGGARQQQQDKAGLSGLQPLALGGNLQAAGTRPGTMLPTASAGAAGSKRKAETLLDPPGGRKAARCEREERCGTCFAPTPPMLLSRRAFTPLHPGTLTSSSPCGLRVSAAAACGRLSSPCSRTVLGSRTWHMCAGGRTPRAAAAGARSRPCCWTAMACPPWRACGSGPSSKSRPWPRCAATASTPSAPRRCRQASALDGGACGARRCVGGAGACSC